MKPIDRSWYHGRHGDQFGMFPVTHVRELDTAPPGEFVPPKEAVQIGGLKSEPLHDGGQGEVTSGSQVSFLEATF